MMTQKVRFMTESWIAMSIGFAVLYALNWLLVTINIMQPESLEKTMRWRGIISRSLWCLFLVLWIRTRTDGCIRIDGSNVLANRAVFKVALCYFVSLAAAAFGLFLSKSRMICDYIYHIFLGPSHDASSEEQKVKKGIRDSTMRHRSQKRIWGQIRKHVQTKMSKESENGSPFPKRRRIFFYGALQEHRYVALYRFIAYAYMQSSRSFKRRISEVHVISNTRNRPSGSCSVDGNSEDWIDDEKTFDSNVRDDAHREYEHNLLHDEKKRLESAVSEEVETQTRIIRQIEHQRQNAFSQFFAGRYFNLIRVTQPDHPRAEKQCEFDITNQKLLRARPFLQSERNDWVERPFDHVFGITATERDIYNKLEPIITELNNPQGRIVCIGTDGFSGSGKSHTTQNLLQNFGKELFRMPCPNRKLCFEAFQSLGTDVNSLDLSTEVLLRYGIEKLDQIPVSMHAPPIPSKRPCYQLDSLAAFEFLVAKTLEFRTSSSTNNNASSSRTHLIILIYAIGAMRKSQLCLFDLAGNERNDALDGHVEDAKARRDQTSAINDSRMKIYAILKYAIRRQKRVTRETADNGDGTHTQHE
ncbi:P-loop containing nucleoside triphosphate hydrolase protein [Bipolaris maydis]|uniref:P-loop containing nucleoside triphosphate hydrolase protein n=1 Tax=Cochliobolus heterostrophus TaxID=5016 RepID=UPI0024D6794C|nr:P-loop containing nucleoside triphosphate hydrolase protein [Bipolaris maydis]KAJ6275447.1 P-loop containing nucleoside triphosphate hydrolase protein [Bipolaris maydis]KAJ6286637.1 P-loop containing nucleoside triphosphate hydrolase protein [Bipolaris maydis]